MQLRRLLLALCVVSLLLAACGGAAGAAPSTPASSSASGTTNTTPSRSSSGGASASAAASTGPSASVAGAAASASANRGALASTEASASVGGVASPSASPGTPEASIEQVILRGNAEQQQALQTHNPAVMQDTSTAAYYQDMAQGIQDMLASGIKSIHLDKLLWGPVTVSGSSAVAQTLETWTTQFSDGTIDQSQARNVYRLIQESGAWKIASDAHPDTSYGMPPGPGSASPRPSTPPVPPQPVSPAGQNASRNWAGYAATGGTYTAVSGTWNVPQLNPTGKPGADATWVGIGGVSSTDLIQAGTQHTVLNSTVQYQAWIETLPMASHPVPLTVHPKDSVTVSISEGQNGVWTVAFKDNTTGQTYNRDVQYQSSLSSAEWIEEAPSTGRGAVLPLDNFGTISFTNSTTQTGGKQAALASVHAAAITMINQAGEPLATTSPIGANGTSFTVTRTSTVASPPPASSAFPNPAPGVMGVR